MEQQTPTQNCPRIVRFNSLKTDPFYRKDMATLTAKEMDFLRDFLVKYQAEDQNEFTRHVYRIGISGFDQAPNVKIKRLGILTDILLACRG